MESLEYILGLLNSRLLDFWIDHKSRKKAKTREYTSSTLYSIPIRRIDFDNPEEVRVHDDIVKKVKTIRDKMVKLASYSKYFKGTRLTRLKLEDPLPDINSEAIVQACPPEERFSLRTHPDIEIGHSRDFKETKFILNEVGNIELTLEGPELKLIGKDQKVIILKGPEALLRIISLIFENHKNESWITIKEIPFIPETAEDYQNKKQEVLEKVMTLRTEIQELQTSIDAIVFKLYGVSENLGKRE